VGDGPGSCSPGSGGAGYQAAASAISQAHEYATDGSSLDVSRSREDRIGGEQV
jgi:hypothetical protein